MDRAGDNQSSLLSPVFGVAEADVVGAFDNAELGASFTCVDAGGTLYGAFSGFLGSGVMQLLVPVAADVWMLPMPRALDHAPPGDWTLAFQRDDAGRVASVQIGCWLARRLLFTRRG
jgi:D-aminopeptidase